MPSADMTPPLWLASAFETSWLGSDFDGQAGFHHQ